MEQSLIEFVKNNVWYIIVGLGVIVFWLNSYLKKHGRWPWQKPVRPIIKPKMQHKPIEPVQAKKEEVNPLAAFADETPKKDSPTGTLDDLYEATKSMHERDIELDNKMLDDLKKAKAEFQAVFDEKEKIKKHGKHLSILYSKYEKREYEIAAIIDGIEKMVGKESKPKQ